MKPGDLTRVLDRLLSDRRSKPAAEVAGLRAAPEKALQPERSIPPSRSTRQERRIERIRQLPPLMQELLRRYYVFQEDEESICFSLGLDSKEFHRLRREATDYVLSRGGAAPVVEQRKPSARAARG